MRPAGGSPFDPSSPSQRAWTTAIAAGFLLLAGCGLNVLDGLTSNSELVIDDASDTGTPADGGQAQRDARADAPKASDAHPDSYVAPDTSDHLDATVDASSSDVASSDVASMDGQSGDGSDGGDPIGTADAGTPGKLSVPSTAVTDSGHNTTFVPANTVDGSLSTRWASNGDGVWITYDLGAIKTLTAVRLAWFQGTSRIYTFDVQISIDNTNWTTVIDRRTNMATTDLQSYSFPNTSGRFVRIVGHRSSVDGYTNITETEIWGF
jgi:hypothetical protein